MPTYRYRGRASNGQMAAGQLEAASASVAADMLAARGIIPLDIMLVKEMRSLSLSQLFPAKVTLDDLHIFTRQMYSLSRSGIPILRAIAGLSDTARSHTMKETLNNISDQLTAGRPLSSAMHQYPNVFNSLFVSMVHVGESTGKLDVIFLQLANYIEREQEIRRQIKSAMHYPMLVFVAISISMVILNIMVIPKFSQMFVRFGNELPWATQVLMVTSNAFVNHWPFMLILITGLGWGLRYWQKTPKGRNQWDQWKLRIPVIGSIIERSTLTRYCRSFSMMHAAGMPTTQALSLVADTVDNAYMHDKIVGMRRGIESGESMFRVSSNSQLFTPLVLQMVAVGEETGQIDQLLNDAADFYEREVDYDLKGLTAKLEPMLIGIVAMIVLVLAIGIYLPMWEMLNITKG